MERSFQKHTSREAIVLENSGFDFNEWNMDGTQLDFESERDTR